MYVTAQRVRNEHGKEGVHAFVYVHGEDSLPGLDWTAPDAGFVAEVHPGQLLLAVRSVSGERLSVRSYLDVAFSNALAAHGAELLRRLIAAWPGGEAWPMSWTTDGIGGRFYVVTTRRDTAEQDLRELHEALLPILGHAVPRELGEAPQTVPSAAPLVILRRRTDRGFEFALEPNSRTRLESLGIPPPHPVISASVDSYSDLQVMTSQRFEREMAPTLTRLTIEQLDALGGVQVRDEAGALVWQSPGLPDSNDAVS